LYDPSLTRSHLPELRIKVGPKGQILIPKIFRERYGLKEGGIAVMESEESGVLIRGRPSRERSSMRSSLLTQYMVSHVVPPVLRFLRRSCPCAPGSAKPSPESFMRSLGNIEPARVWLCLESSCLAGTAKYTYVRWFPPRPQWRIRRPPSQRMHTKPWQERKARKSPSQMPS